jgi:metal-dependent hydrolase (beta-lactamase superfamily II)
MKLTILCDDTVASDRYLTEHGVSILVERPNGHRWLLDTGSRNGDLALDDATPPASP